MIEPHSHLSVKLTSTGLIEQTKVIVKLFLEGKKISINLPPVPADSLGQKAYAMLKTLHPFLHKGLEDFLTSGSISPVFKKNLFRQLPHDKQMEVVEQIYQNGKIAEIESVFPKLAWLAQNKDLPNGLSWIIHRKNFLPPIKKYWNKMGTIRGNWFVFGDKPDGVEEGFLAVPLNEAFLEYFYQMLEANKEIYPKAYAEFEPEASLKILIQKIQKPGPFGKRFLEGMSLDMWEETKKNTMPLDVYMFKQDYEGKKRSARQKALGEEGSYVSPSINRLKKDPFIKETLPILFHRVAAEIKKRFRTLQLPKDQNTNAIIETLVNDLLKMLGLETQDQKIAYCSYEDGSPKILSACLWKKGAKPGKQYLQGNQSPDYEGYYVKNPEKHEEDFFESMPIQFGGALFVSALASGDRDFIGWDGNNKMVILRENLFKLFAIDPGLALREESSILDNMGTDFSFLQPPLATYKYKNLSSLTDNPITEKMMGMMILYYVIPREWHSACFKDEVEIQAVENAFQAYQEAYPEFAELIKTLKPQGLGHTYRKYWECLAIQMDDETLSTQWREQSAHALNQMDEALGRLARNISKLIHVFKDRMGLLPKDVLLLDFWEKKYSEEVGLYSPCGTIKLNHQRVVKGRAIFEMKKHYDPEGLVDGVLLKIPLNKKHLFLEDLKHWIGSSNFKDRTTIKDEEGKIFLSADHYHLLAERVLNPDPNNWIDTDIHEFYQQHLVQISSQEIEQLVNEIENDHERNEALLAINHEDPDTREKLCCQILKNRLLSKQNVIEDNIEIDEAEGTFSKKFETGLLAAAGKIAPELTTENNKQLKEEIKLIVQKIQNLDGMVDSTTPLGEIFLKQAGLKCLQSLYQKFDTQYSKGLFGFFGGQTEMRRRFFNSAFSIFEDKNPHDLAPPPFIKQRFKKYEADFHESCNKELFEKNNNLILF